eukprot:2262546-Rhodomonas_salina.1
MHRNRSCPDLRLDDDELADLIAALSKDEGEESPNTPGAHDHSNRYEDRAQSFEVRTKSVIDRTKSFTGTECSLSSFTSSRAPSSFLAPPVVGSMLKELFNSLDARPFADLSGFLFTVFSHPPPQQRCCISSGLIGFYGLPGSHRNDPSQTSCQDMMRDGGDRWSRESTSFAQRCESCVSMEIAQADLNFADQRHPQRCAPPPALDHLLQGGGTVISARLCKRGGDRSFRQHDPVLSPVSPSLSDIFALAHFLAPGASSRFLFRSPPPSHILPPSCSPSSSSAAASSQIPAPSHLFGRARGR